MKDLLVLIEDLHPDKRVEDQGSQLLFLVVSVVGEDSLATEIEQKGHNQLENSLPDDHLPHVESDQRSRLLLRLTMEDVPGRRVRRKSQGSKGVHDKVDPQQLDSTQHRLLGGASHCGDKGKDDCSDIDRDLELGLLDGDLLLVVRLPGGTSSPRR